MGTKFISSIVLFTLLAAIGCGSRSRSREDLDTARQAVESTLNAWKSNEPLKTFQAKSSIQVSDPDWSLGMKLLSYEIQSTDAPDGKNPRCRAILQLRDRKDRKIEREAIYEVSVDGEKKIVARELFY